MPSHSPASVVTELKLAIDDPEKFRYPAGGSRITTRIHLGPWPPGGSMDSP